MLGPGSASDYSRRLYRVLRIDLPTCSLSWNNGRCAALAALIEGFESASDWTVYGDAAGLAGDDSDPISGDYGLTFTKGSAATGYAGATKLLDYAIDLSGYTRFRVVLQLTAADAAKLSKAEVYFATTAGVADYRRWDFSTLVAGDNFLEFDLASPIASSGSPDMSAVIEFTVALHTTTATDTLAAPVWDDLRGLGTPLAPCHLTLNTCQVESVFRNHYADQAYYFTENDAPPGSIGQDLIVDWHETVGELNPKRGLGPGSTIAIGMIDPLHDGQGVDPYFSARGTKAGHQMRKFLAVHKYLQGRTAYVYEGYCYDDGTPPELSELTPRQYRIDAPPKASPGRVMFTLRDPLAQLEWGEGPADVEGELQADVTSSQLTWELSDADKAASYPTANFYVACEDEIAYVTSRSGTTLTFASTSDRGLFSTTAATHRAGEGVDLVDYYSGSIDSVLQAMLNAGGLPDSILDLSGWSTEVGVWARTDEGYDLSVPIRRQTRRSKLVQDFCESLNLMIWWDPEEQLVKMRFGRPLAPSESYAEITETDHVVKRHAVTVEPDESERITRVRVVHKVRSWVEKLDDPANYKTRRTYADGDAESGLQYGSEILREVFAYWLPDDLDFEAEALGLRGVDRYRDAPYRVQAVVPTYIAAQVSWGGIVRYTTEQVETENGQPQVIEAICVKKQRRKGSRSEWDIVLVETSVFGRWWFWADEDAGNYPQTIAYAHWSNEQGQMNDGTAGYGLI